MTKNEFKAMMEQKIVILDGATGSNLQNYGMPSGICPETWILDNKEVLITLQKEYLIAGTDILYAPTFTSNRIKLAEYGLKYRIKEINHSLVELSKEAIHRYREETGETRPVMIAGDLTMTGEQLLPFGKMDFDELITIYKEQIGHLVAAGVDLLVVETMLSLQECRAAVIAAKETCELPIMVTLTFGEDNRTLFGTDPKTALIVLQSLGADAVGVNCSSGPEKMSEVIKQMLPVANVPLIAKPNAGLPKLVQDKTVFTMDAEEFATSCKIFLELGVSILGGCCGTTPKHINLLNELAKTYQAPVIHKKPLRVLTTERRSMELSLEDRFFVVGERINPTGKKALQAQLREGVLDLVSEMAMEQEELGADILDINMGMNGIDEKVMMLKVMEEVLQVTNLPLSIDSSHVSVIEAALRRYPGRALINSISLEKEKFEKLLPIAKKYGAMFILLPLSDAGLPKDLTEKKQIIHTIVTAAIGIGLTDEDIVVDGLVNTIGANKEAAIQTIETIRYCKEELSLATIVGLSNISFGLPERQFVNATFLSFAIQAGLTMAIANPSQDLLMNTAYAADLLRNKEGADLRYINRVTAHPMAIAEGTPKKAVEKGEDKADKIKSVSETTSEKLNENSTVSLSSPIYEAVIKGNKRKILSLVIEEVNNKTSAAEILDTILIPAINQVGQFFDSGKYYLPQLIASAETMKTAIDYLEPMLKKDSTEEKVGTIIIATVAGDIHDIGKNLVALMLKNYGFTVIDLGKDVPSEKIIETAKQMDADIIALSALMTTTMLEMKRVVRLRNEASLRVKVIIGGAVITQDYCDEIGADGYSKDAQEAVNLVKKILKI
ncbi:homocysteine S-methyltransferase family protein [Lachnoclostridium sp.]|uniref:homocysteine S-methyltransferase family protein n=1 Tax=Lachnoclostridium sp. TaxID=2028282 RepID=UPI0028A1AA24|nr:homocysteine S-methyltransferase family protein [Lachnoclostridium sp.]